MNELAKTPPVGDITVTGSGVASGTPDLMVVHLTCSATRTVLKDAVATAEAAVVRVRAALDAHGITGADAGTGGLSVQANETWDEKTGPKVTGYRADHQITARVRDVSAAGAVLGAVVTAGGDDVRVQGVSLQLKDDAAVQKAAREAAWADAVAKAGHLARLAGRNLGAVIAIVEGSTRGTHPAMEMRAKAMMASASDANVEVEAGAVDVAETLTVSWHLH